MRKAKLWLKQQFEFEYCHECGGDSQHHTVCIVPVTGTFFARCDFPPSEATKWEQHPTISAFRRVADVEQRRIYSAEPE
jgi:hypothetical protein